MPTLRRTLPTRAPFVTNIFKRNIQMKILLASPRGFCAGVNRAINALHETLKQHETPPYVFHEIVHNTGVVRYFREHGVTFVDSLEDVPDGTTLLYSAHGVSPEIRKRAREKGLQTVDATCPLVARIHEQAIRLAEDGVQIVLIGHRGHDEIVGIVGEAPESIHVIGSRSEIQNLTLDPTRKIAYLTQTTLSVTEAQEIVEELKRRYPDILAPKSSCICFATQNRQRAIRELAPRADLVLIVGSATSSNSQRLKELARAQGVSAYLVDGADELDFVWFTDVKTVLISAGASAPEQTVQCVVDKIRSEFEAEVESCEICNETLQFRPPEI